MEEKAFKQQKMTLSNKITYFILVFVKINPVKVSSLKLFWSLKIYPIWKNYSFESPILDKNSILVAKFNFPGNGKDFLLIFCLKKRLSDSFSNFKTLELALQIECRSSRRGKRHSPPRIWSCPSRVSGISRVRKKYKDC